MQCSRSLEPYQITDSRGFMQQIPAHIAFKRRCSSSGFMTPRLSEYSMELQLIAVVGKISKNRKEFSLMSTS